MKNLNKVAVIGAIIFAIGVTSVSAFAASDYNTPADIVAGLTGRAVDEVVAEKAESGDTYGELADQAGMLDAFKAEMLALKKAVLDEKVATGAITRESADEIIEVIEERQENCDGSGSDEDRLYLGLGSMSGHGDGNGQGLNGSGNGYGQNTGIGGSGRNGTANGGGRNGLGDGSGTCIY